MAVHDQHIDQAFARVAKSPGYTTDDIEPQAVPETHGTAVRRDHEVELHREKTLPSRRVQSMETHLPGNAAPPCTIRRDEAGIGDMIAAPLVVGAQKIGADHIAPICSDEDRVACCAPKGERILSAHVERQRIGLAARDHRENDMPDGIDIVRTHRVNDGLGGAPILPTAQREPRRSCMGAIDGNDVRAFGNDGNSPIAACLNARGNSALNAFSAVNAGQASI